MNNKIAKYLTIIILIINCFIFYKQIIENKSVTSILYYYFNNSANTINQFNYKNISTEQYNQKFAFKITNLKISQNNIKLFIPSMYIVPSFIWQEWKNLQFIQNIILLNAKIYLNTSDKKQKIAIKNSYKYTTNKDIESLFSIVKIINIDNATLITLHNKKNIKTNNINAKFLINNKQINTFAKFNIVFNNKITKLSLQSKYDIQNDIADINFDINNINITEVINQITTINLKQYIANKDMMANIILKFKIKALFSKPKIYKVTSNFDIKSGVIQWQGQNINFNNLKAQFNHQLNNYQISEFSATIDNMPINISANLNQVNKNFSGNVIITNDSNINLAIIHKYWPSNIAPLYFNWIKTAIIKGNLSNTKLNFKISGKSLQTLTFQQLYGTAKIINLSCKFMNNVRPIHNLNGDIVFTKQNLVIKNINGNININNKSIKVSQSQIKIIKIISNPHISINLNIDSNINNLINYLYKDFNAYLNDNTKYLITNYNANGMANVKLNLHWDLWNIKELYNNFASLSDIFITSNNINISQKTGQYSIAQANIYALYQNNNIILSGYGKGAMNKAIFTPKVEFNVNIVSNTLAQYQGSALINNQSFKILGYDRILQGNTIIKFTSLPQKQGTKITANLKNLSIDTPVIDWQKNNKQASKLIIQTNKRKNNTTDIKINMHAYKAKIYGQLRLNAQGKLININFNNNYLGQNKFNIKLLNKKNKQTLQITSNNINLNKKNNFYLTNLKQNNNQDSLFKDTLDINIMIKKIQNQYNYNVDNTRVVGLLYKNNKISLHGKININKKKVVFKLINNEQPEDKYNKYLQLHAENAGEFIQLFTGIDKIKYGTMIAKMKFNDKEINTNIEINNLKINIQKFSNILSAFTLAGMSNIILGTKGQMFDSAKFNMTNIKNNYHINNLKIKNKLMAFYAEGDINIKDDYIKLKGYISPVYIINSFLAKIPIIGNLLTVGSKQNDGILVTKYDINGTINNWKMDIHPTSTFLPSSFYSLFE